MIPQKHFQESSLEEELTANYEPAVRKYDPTSTICSWMKYHLDDKYRLPVKLLHLGQAKKK